VCDGLQAIEVDGSDITVLFLDTEGLGSTIRGTTYDCRIFALSLLLSSYFVYNSVGVIDGDAIARLGLVVNLTKHIQVRAAPGDGDGGAESGAEFQQFFPNFLWVVRDFGVRLERDGVAMSSRDYLEDALRPEASASDAAAQKNAVRGVLRQFFPERDCVTMVSVSAVCLLSRQRRRRAHTPCLTSLRAHTPHVAAEHTPCLTSRPTSPWVCRCGPSRTKRP
jgi:hypothetical protein